MNLHALLNQRQTAGKPVRVGLIGAGKFGSMYLSQVKHTPGIHLLAVADLDRACEGGVAECRLGRGEARCGSFRDAQATGNTFIGNDAFAMIAAPELDVIIDATGSPAHGIAHVLACCDAKKHIVMVNVEADAWPAAAGTQGARGRHRLFAGLRRPAGAGVRDGGLVPRRRFRGGGRRQGHQVSAAVSREHPATVWPHYGIAPEDAAKAA